MHNLMYSSTHISSVYNSHTIPIIPQSLTITYSTARGDFLLEWGGQAAAVLVGCITTRVGVDSHTKTSNLKLHVKGNEYQIW